MKKTNQSDRAKNVYDDGDIPEIDLPQNKSQYENVVRLFFKLFIVQFSAFICDSM